MLCNIHLINIGRAIILHTYLQLHCSYTLGRKLLCIGLRSIRVGSGRVVSGLEFGRWKHKTETNQLKTVRVGSGRVVSVLVETRPKAEDNYTKPGLKAEKKSSIP